MFTPDRMEQIHMVFSREDVEPVAEAMIRQGSLQLVDSASIETWAETLDNERPDDNTLTQSKDFQERIRVLLKSLHLRTGLKGIKVSDLSIDQINNDVRKIEKRMDSLIQKQHDFEDELGRLNDLRHRIESMPSHQFSLENDENYAYLTVKTGRIEKAHLSLLEQRLKSHLHVLTTLGEFSDLVNILVIGLKRDHTKIAATLNEVGFQPLDFDKESKSLSPELISSLNEKSEGIYSELSNLDREIEKIANEHGPFLKSALLRIRGDILKKDIHQYFRKTDRTFLVSGWIPGEQRENLILEMKKITQNRCIIETRKAEDVEFVKQGKVDVPVRMQNPRPFRPFELITRAYGIPAYRTIDPTPVLGISFLIIFGMMFGDVGHGLVLALLGILLLLKGSSDLQKHAGTLLCYVGGSSMIFGFLFGSLFGFEHLSWLPPLWMRPMESITELFKVCIYLGIVMIFLSIVINMINAFRLKKFWDVLFDKAGLIAAVLYWAGIVMASRIVTNAPQTQSLAAVAAPIVLVAAMVLLFFREPIIHLFQGKKKLYPEGAFTGVISGLIELMEIALGFLANTVSFIRIAAFGLVHAGLAMAVFSLSDAVGGVGSVFVIIFGNIFIILLEGLIVSIQSVRLEFYEFFSRFFREGQVGYKPLGSELEG